MKLLPIINHALILFVITCKSVCASNSSLEDEDDDIVNFIKNLGLSSPTISNMQMPAFKGETATAREKILLSASGSTKSNSSSSGASSKVSSPSNSQNNGAGDQYYNPYNRSPQPKSLTGSINYRPSSPAIPEQLLRGQVIQSSSSKSTSTSSHESRELLGASVESSIPQDYMRPYFDLFSKPCESANHEVMTLNKDTIIFLEPKDEERHAHRIHIIQAIGPVTSRDSNCEVLPVWLRTGKLIFFYRACKSARWMPVLQYGSSADTVPFSCDTNPFKHGKHYAATYADSAILEKAALELFAMESMMGLPARMDVDDWKVFYVLFGLRLDDTVVSDVTVKLNRSQVYYNLVLSKRAVDGSVVVPMREEKGWLSSGYNQLTRAYAYTLGTSRGIVKAGGSLDKFPNVLDVPLMDCIGHCARIPHPIQSDTHHAYHDAFVSIFAGVFDALTDWFQDTITLRVEAPSDLGSVTFEAEMLEGNENVKIYKVTPESDVKQASVLGAVHPLFLYAKKISTCNPLGADLLYEKAAYRMACLVGTDQGCRLLEKETSSWLRISAYEEAKEELLARVGKALLIAVKEVAVEDIFYYFAMVSGGKKFVNY